MNEFLAIELLEVVSDTRQLGLQLDHLCRLLAPLHLLRFSLCLQLGDLGVLFLARRDSFRDLANLFG
jgi:hypothetical protein